MIFAKVPQPQLPQIKVGATAQITSDADPRINFSGIVREIIPVPAVQVLVVEPGADPSELESNVTKKVEDAVAGLGNIDTITSTITDSTSSTLVNFVLGTDSDRATNDVRNAVSQIRQNLPQDINEPIVQRQQFSGGAIMIYAVESVQQSVTQLSVLVDRTISQALLAAPGVAQIQRIGGVCRPRN